MTIIYFVRHAEPNYANHNDRLRELTEKGLQDRKLVTEFLRDKEIDVILSSPYKRSIDTIKEFADQEGYAIHTIEEFRERKVDSEWIEDFTSFAKQQWADFNYKRLDGETLGEVQNRNICALNEVLTKYPNQNIVIGSHGTALSTIINYYDSKFGYEAFEEIRGLMPWVVKMTFEGTQCTSIESIPLVGK